MHLPICVIVLSVFQWLITLVYNFDFLFCCRKIIQESELLLIKLEQLPMSFEYQSLKF